MQVWWPGGASCQGDTLKRKAALQPAAGQAEVKRVLGRHHSHLLSVPALHVKSFRKAVKMSEGLNEVQVFMDDVVQAAVNDGPGGMPSTPSEQKIMNSD
ncbi:hypothetical protein BH24DEI2_BH24DEI2_27560 [soil metagenome]